MYQNIATKVLTGECRLSYVHLSQPYANPNQQNAEPKYSVTLLIPKSDQATYNDIVKSRDAAYEAAVQNDWKGARPQLRSLLIYDGDGVRQDGSAFGPECKGHYVITASTKRKPQVVDGSNINVELAPQDIYSGMYGRVTLNFYAFNSNGNKGIGCGLGNVLKTRDGEPLAGGSTAAQDFEGVSVPAPAPAAHRHLLMHPALYRRRHLLMHPELYHRPHPHRHMHPELYRRPHPHSRATHPRRDI